MNLTSCLFGSRSAQNPVFLLAGALSIDEKSAKVQLYFGLDCGMMEFFTYRPQSKEQWYLSRIFGAEFGEKDRGLSTCKPWTELAGGLEAFLHEAAQNFEVFSKILNQN